MTDPTHSNKFAVEKYHSKHEKNRFIMEQHLTISTRGSE
jgi:hypothetical protein